MSSITIRPATIDDSDSIANIHYEALQFYHDFYAAFFQLHPRELIPLATKNALQNPGQQHFLVAEQAGKIVGFVRYKEIIKNNKPNSNAKPATSVWTVKKHMEELWAWFNERSEEIDASKEKAVDGQDHFGKCFLCCVFTCIKWLASNAA
jgi:hypothetical protein